MTVKKISDLLFCHSSAVILYYEDQLSFTYVSADPDFSCLPLDVDPVKKSILHKRLKDQSWNIAPVCFLRDLIFHLKASLIAKILQMDIIFQYMDLIGNRKEASLFVDTGLQKLHEISNKPRQLFFPFQKCRKFDGVQCIIHKMRCDLILQCFQLCIFFLLFLFDHLGDQSFDIIQHVVEFFSEGSDLISSSHFCTEAQISLTNLLNRASHGSERSADYSGEPQCQQHSCHKNCTKYSDQKEPHPGKSA